MNHKSALLFVLLSAPFIGLPALATPKPVVVPDGQPSDSKALNTDDATEWWDADVKGFDAVRVARDADLKRYKTFLVEQPTLEFDKYWLREFRSDMTAHDKERIRNSYTRVLRDALQEALNKDLGLQAVDTVNPDTLVITPSLSRFRLNAPDLSFRGITKDFVHYTGSARLELHLRDGASGRALVQLSDHSETRAFGGLGDLKQTNRVENLRDFKMLSKRWAARFADYLGDAQ